jgi:hypothetical protein
MTPPPGRMGQDRVRDAPGPVLPGAVRSAFAPYLLRS